MHEVFLAAKVALSNTSYSFDKEYTYYIPADLHSSTAVGMRVLVPFGKGNKKRVGLITRLYNKTEFDSKIKEIFYVLDKEPCVNSEMLELIYYLKENTFCTYFDALKAIIPTGMGISFDEKYKVNPDFDGNTLNSEYAKLFNEFSHVKVDKLQQVISNLTKSQFAIFKGLLEKNALIVDTSYKTKVGNETIRMVKLNDEFIDFNQEIKLTEKQKLTLEKMADRETASVKELCYLAGVTTVVVNKLIEKKVLIEYEMEVFRKPNSDIVQNIDVNSIELSQKQSEVFAGIKELIDSEKPHGAVLHGVTGSGKTSVFIKLIEYVINGGKSAIMLVPEISLTPQMVEKFKGIFGDTVAVIHSNLSAGQRLDEFKRIKSGEVKIVIGTRSAIFAPLSNIGLIIMDEEGERSYKSEGSPRYHARDVAIFRCGKHKSVLLMASATPSIETYFYAKNERFKLFNLTERYSGTPLPKVLTVDMQIEAENGFTGTFSGELINKIKDKIAKKEQVILLLNRRGFHTYISCVDCRKPLVCPNCSIPLTYHKQNDLLICHYCTYQKELDKSCPSCGSKKIKPSGLGTQKLEEEISAIFPEARVLRMDADTTYSRYAYEKSFNQFKNQKYDIMVGTQMIAKGLDFPNVTLVGILSLDKALFMGDFRSYERTFSLITQVVGRSGRAEKEGLAIVQTFVPEHYVLNLAANQDYISFYNEEIALRKVLIYPPFCDLCVIIFSATTLNSVERAANEFYSLIKQKIHKEKIDFPLRVLGPSKCLHERINNKFKHRIILKCKNTKDFRKFISELLISTSFNNYFANVTISVDINGDVL